MDNATTIQRCTIGIPAYNEETTLPIVLETLRQQELPDDWHIHIIVAANGCKDRTVLMALQFGHDTCSAPQEVVQQEMHWWHFSDPAFDYSVCEVPIASRNYALNLIHEASVSDVIILFDADVRLGPGVVKAILRAFSENPQHGAIAPSFVGDIDPVNPANGRFAEWCRIWVSRAMNNFDQYGMRLDGRGYSYRHHLIDEHPNVIAVDLWMEGTVWQRTAGCIYLTDVEVRYQFPKNFREFVTQHLRYDKTIADLRRKHPDVVAAINRGRKQFGYKRGRPPYLVYRLIGWMFFKWIALHARSRIYEEGKPWEVIRSTKS